MELQGKLFDSPTIAARRPKGQLLKWIGNKQRMAEEIVSYFPTEFRRYHEPFLGGGAVLATLAPDRSFASDSFSPLMDIWTKLREDQSELKRWYADRWNRMESGDKVDVYEEVKASYNRSPNGADLLFLCRAAYGGVVRFRKLDGYMSTPCGAHRPITPTAFAKRVDEWHYRTSGTTFRNVEFEDAMEEARAGDVVYCDPPYRHSQAILYGAQSFCLDRLFAAIERCKRRGVFVALSIDGKKRSGSTVCELEIPDGLFEQERFVHVGRSMLRRFQMGGKTLEKEVVHDRLLLTK